MHRYLSTSATVFAYGRWAPVLLLAVFIGCGSGHVERPEVPEEESVSSLVGSLGSICESATGAELAFVEGAVPSDKDRRRYADHIYEVDSVEVDGDTAKAKATVLDRDENVVGKMEVVCVREGTEWKFRSVMFP